MYKLRLADGTEIEFSGMNGDNFIVPNQKEMDTSIFTDENLQTVAVTNDEGDEIEFENWTFVQQQKQLNGDYYICFHQKSPQEILNDELQAVLVQLAEVEVSAGNLELEDIASEKIKAAVKVKIDDGKRLDK